MKPRHAAAPALVGWYLMLPPGFKSAAQLSKWEVQDSFDTAMECTQGRGNLMKSFRKALEEEQVQEKEALEKLPKDTAVLEATPPILRAYIREKYYARCVASDDPRLKEK
jgi:hypothetical protein